MTQACRTEIEPWNCRDVLTPRQVRTCALAWQDGLSYRQIASLHGVSERTVATRINRARRRLRAAGITPPCNSRSSGRTRSSPAQLSLFFNY